MKERLVRRPRAVAFGVLAVLAGLGAAVAFDANAQSYPPQTPFVSSLGGRGGGGGGGGLTETTADSLYCALVGGQAVPGCAMKGSVSTTAVGSASIQTVLEAYRDFSDAGRTFRLFTYPTFGTGWVINGPAIGGADEFAGLSARADVLELGAGDARPVATAVNQLACFSADIANANPASLQRRACVNPSGSFTTGMNSGATDSTFSESSIDRSSATHETFSHVNSGAGSANLTITGDSLPSTSDRVFTVTATLPAGNAQGINSTITAVATTTAPFGWFHTLTSSAALSATPSFSILVDNTTEGTESVTGLFGTHGAHGVEARSYSATNTTTTQARTGFVGISWDSSTFNLGILSQSYGDPAVWTSPGAVNIGNLSTAYNGNNVGGLAVAGFFMLRNGTAGNPAVTTSAAFLADNGDQNEDIIALRDNGVMMMEVANGGVLTGNMASDAVADFCWNGDTVACILFADASTDKVTIEQLIVNNGMSATNGNVSASAGNVIGDQFVGDDAILTCAAGVATYNPAAADIVRYVGVDAAGAACVITLGKTNAVLGTTITFYVATSAGAGAVTWPDVAGTHNGPTLCTTTGLSVDGSYTITFANQVTDQYLGVACTQN